SDAGYVPARPGQALDVPSRHRIVPRRHHDGNGRRRPTCRLDPRAAPGHDDVDVEPHELASQLAELRRASFGVAILDEKARPYGPAEAAQAAVEGLSLHSGRFGRAAGAEDADAVQSGQRLRQRVGVLDEQGNEQQTGGESLHTRSSSSFVPKSPHGRTSSIASRQRNGETSASNGSPYRTDSTSTAATTSAPGITPPRLSSPPTSATAKAFRPRTPSEGSSRTVFA